MEIGKTEKGRGEGGKITLILILGHNITHFRQEKTKEKKIVQDESGHWESNLGLLTLKSDDLTIAQGHIE